MEMDRKKMLDRLDLIEAHKKGEGVFVLADKIDELQKKIEEIEIPETNLQPLEDKLDRLALEVKKKPTLSDLQISDELKAELKGEKGDTRIVDRIIEKRTERVEVVRDRPIDTDKIALKASKIAKDELKSEIGHIPTLQELEDKLPTFGEKYRDGLELLQGDEQLDVSAIKGVKELILKSIEVIKGETTRLIGGAAGLRFFINGVKQGLMKVINIRGANGVTVAKTNIDGMDTITIDAPGYLKIDQTEEQETVGRFLFPDVVSTSGFHIEYDDDGNIESITKGGIMYSYVCDSFGRPTSVSDGTKTRTFVYDGDYLTDGSSFA